MTQTSAIPSEAHRAVRRAPFEIEADIADLLSPVTVQTLRKYGSWLCALMEKQIPPETPEQYRFIRLMDHPGDGDTDFERAWKEYAPYRYAQRLQQYIGLYHGGGAGYSFLSDALWVPSGSAKNERYGFQLSSNDKRFFLSDLGSRIGPDLEDQQGILVRDPEALFWKLLQIGRRGETESATREVEALILSHEVEYVAIFDDEDDRSRAKDLLIRPGVLERYLAEATLECAYVGYLRAFLDSMYEWQQEYVVPLDVIGDFLRGLLHITDSAGRYGRSRMLILEKARAAKLSREASLLLQEHDEAYAQQLKDELEDHWRAVSKHDVSYDESEVLQGPAYDPDDLDDIDYQQHRFSPEDSEEFQ